MDRVPSFIIALTGVLSIAAGLLGSLARRRLGLRAWSDYFTIPALQHSARIEERVLQVSLVLLGIGSVCWGIGSGFSRLPDIVFAIGLFFFGMGAIGLVIALGVALAHWQTRQRE